MGSFLSKLWWWTTPEPGSNIAGGPSRHSSYDKIETSYEPQPSYYSKPPEPEIKELHRTEEIKTERETIKNDAGSTTEDTPLPSLSAKISQPKDASDERCHEITLEQEAREENENVTGAVVKIQAGVRGYLTRKALKENPKQTKVETGEVNGITANSLIQPEKASVVLKEPAIVVDEEEYEEDEEEEEEEEEEEIRKIPAAVSAPFVPRSTKTEPVTIVNVVDKSSAKGMEDDEEDEDEEEEEEEEEDEEDSQSAGFTVHPQTKKGP